MGFTVIILILITYLFNRYLETYCMQVLGLFLGVTVNGQKAFFGVCIQKIQQMFRKVILVNVVFKFRLVVAYQFCIKFREELLFFGFFLFGFSDFARLFWFYFTVRFYILRYYCEVFWKRCSRLYCIQSSDRLLRLWGVGGGKVLRMQIFGFGQILDVGFGGGLGICILILGGSDFF